MVKFFKYLILVFLGFLHISIVAMEKQKLDLIGPHINTATKKQAEQIKKTSSMLDEYVVLGDHSFKFLYSPAIRNFVRQHLRQQITNSEKAEHKIMKLIGEYIKDWTCVQEVQEEMIPNVFSDKILFSPCSNYLLTLRSDGTIRMYALREPNNEHGFLGNVNIKNEFASAAAFSPDGKYIATGNNDGTLNILDYNLYIKGYLLKAHENDNQDLRCIEGLAYTPDSKYLISACRDSSIKVWNVEDIHDIKCIKAISNNKCENQELASNNKSAFSGGMFDYFAFNNNDGENILKKTENKLFTALTISNDGKFMACATSDLSLKIWDLKDITNIKVMETLKHNHTKQIHSLAFSETGHLVSNSDDSICVKQVFNAINKVDYLFDPTCYTLASSPGNKLTAFALIKDLLAFPKSNAKKALLDEKHIVDVKIPSISTRNFLENLEQIQRGDIGIDIEFLEDIDNCKAMTFSPDGKCLAAICSSKKNSLMPISRNVYNKDYYYLKVYASVDSGIFKKTANSSSSWCTIS